VEGLQERLLPLAQVLQALDLLFWALGLPFRALTDHRLPL
jgi:hypothetical protein